MDREQFLRRFKELQDEHRRALGAGDAATLDRVQTDLAELMKQREPEPAQLSPTHGEEAACLFARR
jgi:hypothetical protein